MLMSHEARHLAHPELVDSTVSKTPEVIHYLLNYLESRIIDDARGGFISTLVIVKGLPVYYKDQDTDEVYESVVKSLEEAGYLVLCKKIKAEKGYHHRFILGWGSEKENKK